MSHQSTRIWTMHLKQSLLPPVEGAAGRKERNVYYSWWPAQWRLTKFCNHNLRLCAAESLLDHPKYMHVHAVFWILHIVVAWLICQWIYSLFQSPIVPFLCVVSFIAIVSDKWCSNTQELYIRLYWGHINHRLFQFQKPIIIILKSLFIKSLRGKKVPFQRCPVWVNAATTAESFVDLIHVCIFNQIAISWCLLIFTWLLWE